MNAIIVDAAGLEARLPPLDRCCSNLCAAIPGSEPLCAYTWQRGGQWRIGGTMFKVGRAVIGISSQSAPDAGLSTHLS